MTEDYDQPRAEPLSSKLHTADLRGSNDIPGNARRVGDYLMARLNDLLARLRTHGLIAT